MTDESFLAKWEAEAERFDRYGAQVNGSKLCRDILADYRRLLELGGDGELTLTEAALQSGYSGAHLMRLVKEGKLLSLRPPRSRGHHRFRLGDLPSKPGHEHTSDAGMHELASRLFGGREAPNGRS